MKCYKPRKILAGKGLVLRAFKDFLQVNRNNANNPVEQWVGDMNDILPKQKHIWSTNM